MPVFGTAQHFYNGFNVVLPVHCMTVMRGAVVLTSQFICPAPLRALALYFKSFEQFGSLMVIPDIVRAFWIDGNNTESLSLSLMHSARSVKALMQGANLKLSALFIDLLDVIDATGRVLGIIVQEDHLRASYDLYDRVGRVDISAEDRSYNNYGSRDQYKFTKLLEVAMYTAAIGALIIPLVVTSAWGGGFALLAEVSYAALSIFHYIYRGSATNYLEAGGSLGANGDGGGGDDPPSCKGSKQSLVRLANSVMGSPAERAPAAAQNGSENLMAQTLVDTPDTVLVGEPT